MRASGPVLDACPEVAWEQFAVAGAAPRRACRGDRPTPDFREAVYISLTPPSRSTVTLDTPLVVRGAAAGWDATRITFDELAAACGQRGLTAEFFAGTPAEQGSASTPKRLPVEPHLRELAAVDAATPAELPATAGLCVAAASAGDAPAFEMNWPWLLSLRPAAARARYLANWNNAALRALPSVTHGLRPRVLWPSRWISVFNHLFAGPAHTFTGLHYDKTANFNVQLRGCKDWLLLARGQEDALSPSTKYDYAATLSSVDLMALSEAVAGGGKADAEAEAVLRRFSTVKGWYVRMRPGDALWVPAGVWHSVVALQPSLSVSLFGLSPTEMLFNGAWMLFLDVLHKLGLWRAQSCTCCHKRR